MTEKEITRQFWFQMSNLHMFSKRNYHLVCCNLNDPSIAKERKDRKNRRKYRRMEGEFSILVVFEMLLVKMKLRMPVSLGVSLKENATMANSLNRGLWEKG